MKYYFSLFYAFCIIVLISCSNSKEVKKEVMDNANIFTDTNEVILANLLKEINKETNCDFSVITVKTTDGVPPRDFSINLANKYGIGQEGLSNGALLFISLKEKAIELRIGYGLEWQITDSIAKTVIDSIIPFLQQGKYAEGISYWSNRMRQFGNVNTWSITYNSFDDFYKSNKVPNNAIVILNKNDIEIQSFENNKIIGLLDSKRIEINYKPDMADLLMAIKSSDKDALYVRCISKNPLNFNLLGIGKN